MQKEFCCPHCFAPFAKGAVACPACGRVVENENPVGTLHYGSVVAEEYIIGAFAGVDGEGITYHAVQKSTARAVCIKEYLPITLAADRTADGIIHPKQGSGVMFKTTRMDFADLYSALQGITPAKGLQTVLDLAEDNNTAYAVLEQVEGVPLGTYLKEHSAGGTLSPAQANKLLSRVLEGVATMHAAGLVHRGISPENIMVQAGGQACLTGYATIGLRTMGSTLRPQLYEGYSAPEQYDTAAFEGWYTDVYCLAAVYYTLLTGQTPASAGQRLVVDANPAARRLVSNVPRWLSDLLNLALCMNPAQRLQTVAELEKCLADQQTAQLKLLEAKRAQRKPSAFSGPVGIGLIALAAVLCIGLWAVLSGFVGNVFAPAPTPTPVPTAAPSPTPTAVLVEDFSGLLYSQLVATTAYNDKYLFYVEYEQYSDEVLGTVLSQTPKAGEVLGDDVLIGLVVSKGPALVEVPQIFGFTQESAAQELTAAGIAGSFVMKVNDGSYASGCVIKTDPEAGTQVKANTTVTVYIAADRDVQVIATPEPSATPAPSTAPVPSVTPKPSVAP